MAPSSPGRDRAIEAGNLRPEPRGSAGHRPEAAREEPHRPLRFSRR